MRRVRHPRRPPRRPRQRRRTRLRTRRHRQPPRPLHPPIGTVFAAWGPLSRTERWLRALPPASPGGSPDRDQLRTALARVRERQYSVAGGSSRHWELTTINEKLLQPGGGDSDALVRRRQEIIARLIDDYEPECLDHDVNDVRSVNVPVFTSPASSGTGSDVAFMLSVFGLPDRVSGDQVQAYVNRLLPEAKALTAALGGTWPEPAPPRQAEAV